MLNNRDALRRAAMWNADRTAIISGSRRLLFREAWDRGVRLANGLLSLGLVAGDRVAVLEDNCIEAADFFLAMAVAQSGSGASLQAQSPEAHALMIRQTG